MTRAGIAAACALWLASPAAAAGPASMPEPGEDFSAYRVDTDVWGWSKDWSEMAALGSEVRRGRLSEHRGEAFLLVFPVGSATPKHNVQVLFVTQAALPHDPVPLDDVRSLMWGIDVEYQNMWPRRLRESHYKGAMLIEPVWQPKEVEPGICRPLVGFVMRYRGRVRYQPHYELEMKASCPELRLTDTRTYWARKDLGAVMMRFDYSPTKNEQSIRFPLSVSWELGKPVRLMLRAAELDAAETRKLRAELQSLGSVELQPGEAGGGWRVRYRPELQCLARQVAEKVGGSLTDGSPPDGTDILVTSASAQPHGDAPALDSFDRQPDCGGLLRDCNGGWNSSHPR